MAQKRKAHEAFGQANGRLSAFAAARLAKQPKPAKASLENEDDAFDTNVAQTPYDGHHAAFDNSSDDGLQRDLQIAARPRPTGSTPLSTIKPKLVRELEHKTLEINFRTDEVAACVGIYDVEVLRGIILVYGATLTPNSGRQRVYSPSTAALPQIIAKRSGTVILLHHVKSGLSKIGKLSPLFKKVWTKKGSKCSFKLLYTTDDDDLQRSLSVLEVDRTTEKLLARLSVESNSRAPRILAIGVKSSGKSTLNRLISNTLLGKPATSQKVQCLDLDPGQPEFGVPGQISLVEVNAPLLGPSFTHPASVNNQDYKLVRSHSIAASSFKDDPDHYVGCVKDLIRYVNTAMPLIVNTCGWISGLGATITADLVKVTGVTDLIVLDPVEDALVEALQRTAISMHVHRLPRQPSRPSSRTPAELRNMQTMAYFHQSTHGLDAKWTTKPINSVRPWIMKYAEPGAGIRAIVSYGQAPSPDYLAEVLDGSVVAIVAVEPLHLSAAFGRQEEDDTKAWLANTAEGLPYPVPDEPDVCQPLIPKFSQCIGLGLVRAIDVEQRQLQLVTPIPESRIAGLTNKEVVLVRGSFDAPEWAYLEDLYNEGERAAGLDRPWVSRREPVGVEGAVWRLRHTPMSRPT